MQDINTIIFDYDGVLANSDNFNTNACIFAAKECGIEIDMNEYSKYFYPGVTLKLGAENLLDKHNKIELLDKFITSKKSFDPNYKNEVEAIAGAVEFIKNISDKYTLAINSGTRRILLDMFLERYDLVNMFKSIVTAEDIKNPKPNPEGYLKTLKNLNIKPENAIVIEDAPSGIESAHNASIKAVAIETTFSKEKLMTADYIVSNYADLLNLISPNS